jgi:hypothetical protein
MKKVARSSLLAVNASWTGDHVQENFDKRDEKSTDNLPA